MSSNENAKKMSNEESILISIKKLLGLDSENTDFDTDIIIHINTILNNLVQMGIGPKDGFFITDKTSMWSDFIGNDARLEQVKSYVYLRVRLLFDPPANSTLIDSINKNAKELEWRLYIQKGGY